MIVFRLTLGKVEYEHELPEKLSTQKFVEALTDWLTHKKERRETYKNVGFKALLRKLAELGEQRAVAAIEYSLAQGYSGIFEPKTQLSVARPSPRPTPPRFAPREEPRDSVTPEGARRSVEALPEEFQKRFGIGKYRKEEE